MPSNGELHSAIGPSRAVDRSRDPGSQWLPPVDQPTIVANELAATFCQTMCAVPLGNSCLPQRICT